MFDILNFGNGLTLLLSTILVYFANKYLVPYLKVEKHRRYAEWIAHLADEITDDLVVAYPASEWLTYVDEAIDKLMEVCGIEKDIAQRAVNSSLERKKIALPENEKAQTA